MLIDSHCHLYLKSLDADLLAVLERAANQGVTRVICPGIDLETSERSAAIAAAHDTVFAAVGIHPNYSSDLPGDFLDRLRLLEIEEKVVAIGEIGLDYYRDYCPRARQQEIFRQQLELALELDRPVIIHNRSADADVIAILKESEIKKGVAHCFSGGILWLSSFWNWVFTYHLPAT